MYYPISKDFAETLFLEGLPVLAYCEQNDDLVEVSSIAMLEAYGEFYIE